MNAKPITKAVPPRWLIGNEYSSVCPFNATNTHLILVAVDHFILCDGDGAFQADLPIAAFQEPRWSRTDPERLYFIENNALVSLKVGMPGTIDTEHLFAEYIKISGKGESDISLDGEHFALCGTLPDGGLEVFVYNRLTKKKDYLTPVLPFDGLKISASNHWILSRTSDPRDPVNDGIFTPHWRVLAFNGHACPARYKDQDQLQDVLLWCNAAENPITRPNCPNGVIMVRLSDGFQTPLKSVLPWDYAFHISACDRNFCLVSTYSKMNPGLPMELWKVPLDGSAETFLGTTGGKYVDRGDNGYASQPKAALSRDGTRAVYSVDDGQAVNTWVMDVAEPPASSIQPPAPIIVLTEDVGLLKSQLNEKSKQLMDAQNALDLARGEKAELEDDIRVASAAYAKNRDEYLQRIAELEDEVRDRAVGMNQAYERLLARIAELEAQLSNPEPDPALWHEIQFLPEQVGTRWGYEVLPSRRLSMSDIDKQSGRWTPIDYRPLEGNRWEFLAANGELRMFEKKSNKKQ